MTGETLRVWRLALQLSRAKMAGLLCVHPMTLTKWERGERRISPAMEQLIIRVCVETVKAQRPPGKNYRSP